MNHKAGNPEGQSSDEAPVFVLVGDGAEPSTALREALALRDVLEAMGTALREKGIAAEPSQRAPHLVDAPARERARTVRASAARHHRPVGRWTDDCRQ